MTIQDDVKFLMGYCRSISARWMHVQEKTTWKKIHSFDDMYGACIPVPQPSEEVFARILDTGTYVVLKFSFARKVPSEGYWERQRYGDFKEVSQDARVVETNVENAYRIAAEYVKQFETAVPYSIPSIQG